MPWLTTALKRQTVKVCELDVLVGHPEHDLLFVATQVARAAGLKSQSASVSMFRTSNSALAGEVQFHSLTPAFNQIEDQPSRQVLQSNSWMANEGWVYRMLMRGDSKAAESFRSWIADEVVPTIRKTGQYNAAESSDPIVVGIMDELKALCLLGPGRLTFKTPHYGCTPAAATGGPQT